MKKYLLLILFLLILASIKYFYKFDQRETFEYDQEYLAQQAKLILVDKKLTLIGAPTSNGGMFIGPFYNYFMALAFWLGKMSPYTVGFVNNSWAVITLVMIFFVAKKLNGVLAAAFSFFLALLSFQFLNHLPPLLFPLSLISLLIYYLLAQKKSKPLLLGMLAGVALHLHFTALFFLPTIFFFKPLKVGLFLGTVFLFSLPLFIFDLRHSFLISKNFFIFLSQKNDLEFNFLSQLGNSLTNCLGNLSSLFFPASLFLPGFFISSLLIIIFLFTSRKNLKLTLYWLFFPIALFAFYKGRMINYYFALQEPIFLLLAGYIFAHLFKNLTGKFFSLLFLSIVIFFNFKSWYYWYPDPSLHSKLKAFDFIKERVGNQPLYLSFTIEPGRQGGYDYLAFYYHFNLQPKPNLSLYPTYTIFYPHFWRNIKPDYVFGTIGVGVPKS